MEEFGTIARHGDLVDLRYERWYPRPIETVWAALTDAERLGDWLGKAEVEPRLGGRFDVFVDRPRRVAGQVLTWQPPRLLEFSWDTGDAPPSVVRCELTSDGDGTRLVFVHKGVGANWIALVLPGWHGLLERLTSLMAGDLLANSMTRWRELQKLYVDRYKLEGVTLDPPPGHGG